MAKLVRVPEARSLFNKNVMLAPCVTPSIRAGFRTFLTTPGPPLQALYHIRPPHIRPPFPYQTPHPRPTILSPDDQYEAPC